MTQSITIRAKTVEEAVRLALEHLGLESDQVEVAVLEEGGLGPDEAEEALVRVTSKVSSAPPTQGDADPLEIGYEILSGMLQRMGFQSEISPGAYSLTSDESQPILSISAPDERDSGLLIGRRGETLRRVQFLVNLMVSRRIHRWPYILVDVGSYRRRRDASLQDMARRMADRVSHSHQPITLEPMPAYERRILHLTLRDDPLVVTQSTGEGDNRKVVIYPAGWELPTLS
jgi:spoIIIJ-associated protein